MRFWWVLLPVFASTFNWSVPFLSCLAVLLFVVAALLLYYVPLRYVILTWGEYPHTASGWGRNL